MITCRAHVVDINNFSVEAYHRAHQAGKIVELDLDMCHYFRGSLDDRFGEFVSPVPGNCLASSR